MVALSRRDLLAASAGAVLLPSMAAAGVKRQRRRTLRVAHLTDIHCQYDKGAADGFEKCIEHAQTHKPDFILTGGDLIMDSMAQDRQQTKRQWDVFTRVLKANTNLPIEHTIGNHDVWGWGARDKFAGEPGFGKQLACEVLELKKPYRSFCKGGWHFIILDSTYPVDGNGYTARLDDEQFEWLTGELERVKTKPIIVVSHIPIISACSFFDGPNERTGNWVIPGAWVHIDARRIKDLFKKHPNVKLCVSGHEHLIDQVLYNGVTYCCNGAVCAGWWKGDHQECTFGYGLIDLYDDGSFNNRYVSYGWKAR